VINAIKRQLPALAKNNFLPLNAQSETKLQCPAMMIMIWQKERAEVKRQKSQTSQTQSQTRPKIGNQVATSNRPSIHPSIHPTVGLPIPTQ